MADPVNTGLMNPEMIEAAIPDPLEEGVAEKDIATTPAINGRGSGHSQDGDGRDSTLELERVKKNKEAVKTVPFMSLFKFADGLDKFLLVVGTIAAIGTGASQPLMTLLFGELINAFGENGTDTDKLVREVGKVALKFVYLGIGAGVGGYLEVACYMIAGERQGAQIRSRYLRAVLRQDVSFFDTDTSTGEVIARMAGDTMLIQDAIGEKVGKFIQLFATFLGGFIIAFTKSWKLTLVLMAVMPLITVSGGVMATFVSKMSNNAQAAYADAGTLVEQVIGAIRTVAAYTGEKKAVQDYDNNLAGAEKAGILEGLVNGVGVGILIATMLASYSLALWYGSKLVLSGDLNGGQVINVIFAVLTGALAMGQASPSVGAIAAGRSAAFTIFQVIKRTPPIDVYNESGLVLDNLKGDVELRKVDFSYPTRPDVPIFNEFSLLIPAGMTIALVGESGSGKSTVVSLIERFYDPNSGEVLLDGVDIKTIQLKWLRQQIGLVSQEPVLFSTSIKENIAYGKEDATMEEIEKAAHLANATKFITRIPEGYETLVGERGIQLSGGQKQRVAIARAILKNPRILLLDEATSALDAESERVVQDALDRLMTGRTTVVVAHRLTTIRNADMIAVVQRGVIVETGAHDELIQKPDGAYSQLVRLQQVHRENEKSLLMGTNEDPDYVPATEEGESSMKEYARFSGSVRKSSSMGSGRSLAAIVHRSFSRRSSREQGSILPTGVSPSPSTGAMNVESDTKLTKAIKDVSLLRLVKLNKPEAPLFLIGSAAAAVAGLIFPIFGLLLSSVISSFFKPPHKLRQEVNFWSLMFLALAVSVGIATPIQKLTFAIVGQRLIRRVRRLTFTKVVHQEISWFDEEANSSGAISARLSTDAAAVRGLVGDALSLVVQNLATIIAALTIAFIASWQLALVILALVPLFGVQSYAQIKWLKGFGEEAKVKYEEASRVANDAVSSIRTVASFGAEQRVSALFDEKCKEPVRQGIRQAGVAGIGLAMGNFIMFASFAVCFYVGGKLVDNGTTTFRNVFRVFFAISISSTGVTQTAAMSPDIGKVKLAVNSIFGILDRKSKIDPSDTSGQILEEAKGEIEFRRVCFRYPTRPDIQIFQNLSFKVQAGQISNEPFSSIDGLFDHKITSLEVGYRSHSAFFVSDAIEQALEKTLALVGESGSGKSTVISLIERFYEPESGVILMDGVDIKKLQIKWLRQQIGLVSQEPVLFDENVDWNIVYGKEGNVTQSEIQAAAEAANAHKFISALPEGYKTRVGERGTQLSGGQKQRVAIARAILKDPKILLLDEATSALDAESEHVVQEALDRIMVNRTTIVVAHRLSTVRNADIIAVVKDGAIVEQGKHEQLIARNGAYASLVKLHMASS